MSELKLKGKIKLIAEKQVFDSGFEKVEFVITTDDQYPQDVKFEVIKEKADNLIKFNKVGDIVDVSFNVRGNEYNDKYYVSLQAWKVFKSDGSDPVQEQKEEDLIVELEDDEDILPF